MAKGLRKTVILNPDNPKDKKILEELDKQYNYGEFIRNVLYEHILNNNILHDGNGITTPLPYHDNTMIIPLSHNDNTIITPLPSCDNKDFLIDIGNISDEDASINMQVTEDPSKNALDFLKNSF